MLRADAGEYILDNMMVFQNYAQMPIFAIFSDEQLAALQIAGRRSRAWSRGRCCFTRTTRRRACSSFWKANWRSSSASAGRPSTLARRSAPARMRTQQRIDSHSVVVAAVQAGSFVGETSLLTGLPHSAAARATMPTVCLKYDADLFQGLREFAAGPVGHDDDGRAPARHRIAGAAAREALGTGQDGGGAWRTN